MPKMAICVCGQQFQISGDDPNLPEQCPACGRVVNSQESQEKLDDPPIEIPESAFQEVPASVPDPTKPPLFLRLLLDPTTIQRLLCFGGGLSVIGLIAWLVSLGVFDDPRILAVALGAGNLLLLGSGWGVALRSRYRLAGQALTFMACVVAPFNLWFYDAQGLLTVDGHLWMGGLVCSLIYIVTVWKLRDPLFLYAVEAGITLTMLLFLGDLQRATDSSAICLAMVILAAISIHAEAVFDPNHPTFSRRRFGLPLFFSGQVQLAVGMISLLVLQGFGWMFGPTPGDWHYSQIATTPWLAGGLWLAAAYLWMYSDLVVRKLNVYTYAAAVALVLAEITLLNAYLPVEALIIGLSVTALLVQQVSRRLTDPESRWSFVVSNASLILGAITLAIGLIRHFQAAFPIPIEAIRDPLLFAAAMLSIAINLGYQGLIQKRRSMLTVASWICAGSALWLGSMHALDVVGIQVLSQQAPLLTLLPLAIVLLAPRILNGERMHGAVWAAHGTLILGLFLSATSVDSISEWSEFLLSGARATSTLCAGILFLELAAIYFATYRIGSRLQMFAMAIVCSLVSGWKFLVFVDLPEIWYGPMLAAGGLALTIVERFRSATVAVDTATNTARDAQATSAMSTAAGLSFVLGQLIAFFQTLPWLAGSHQSIPTLSLLAVLLTAGASVVGAFVATTRSTRGWHGFAAVMIATVTILAWLKTLQLADYQKLELVLEFLGLVWLIGGCSGRLHETDRQRNLGVSLALWAGSITATAPVFFCTLMHRWSRSGPSLADEIGLITITTLMVAIGCVLQIRATTSIGGMALSVYLAVLFGHLAYHPQVAIGVYLAAGGAMIFMTGVILSIYRDRLLALPSKIANREGIFQIIDWR